MPSAFHTLSYSTITMGFYLNLCFMDEEVESHRDEQAVK